MPIILVCNSHQAQGYPPTIGGTPTAFDIPGALSADLADEVPQPGGVPRTQLDCPDCAWLLDSVAADATPEVLAVEKDAPCPICHGEVGHRVNCPRGIAFSTDMPTVEKALGTVGNPTDRPSLKQVRDHNKQRNERKEKNMATVAKPLRRERRRGTPIVKEFGAVKVLLYVEGWTVDNVMALPEDTCKELFDLFTGRRQEPPHA